MVTFLPVDTVICVQTLKGGSKVGVVGRTGAGKSSLITALLRLAPTRGIVKIDGQHTCALPLKVVRRAINLIPQDPTLFSGTVRCNLDPFDGSDDAALWSAIESAQLKPCIVALYGTRLYHGFC
jgi:ATP-binding cassette subfamily C (CFTR/MRP) protein 4